MKFTLVYLGSDAFTIALLIFYTKFVYFLPYFLITVFIVYLALDAAKAFILLPAEELVANLEENWLFLTIPLISVNFLIKFIFL